MEIEFLGFKINSIKLNLAILTPIFVWGVKSIKNHRYNKQFKKLKNYIESNIIIYINGSYFDNDIYFKNKDNANLNKLLNINNKIIKKIIKDLENDEYIRIEEVDGGTFIMNNF